MVTSVTVDFMSSSDVLGIGDFNGNGIDDILVLNPLGNIQIWTDGSTASTINLGPAASGSSFAGVGDFNLDGTDDILFTNAGTGAVTAWQMSASSIATTLNLGTVSAGWKVEGVGDIDGDFSDDVVFRNTSTGAVGAWDVAGGSVGGWYSMSTAASSWQVIGIDDMDGDGTEDVMFFSASTGTAGAWKMNGGAVASFLPFSVTNAAIVTGNWDADPAAELVDYNVATGQAVFQGYAGASAPHANLAGYTYIGSGEFTGGGTDELLWQDANGTVAYFVL